MQERKNLGNRKKGKDVIIDSFKIRALFVRVSCLYVAFYPKLPFCLVKNVIS
jgi:hypothetical protein